MNGVLMFSAYQYRPDTDWQLRKGKAKCWPLILLCACDGVGHSGWQTLSLECKWRVRVGRPHTLPPLWHAHNSHSFSSAALFLHQNCLCKNRQLLLRHNNVWHPRPPPFHPALPPSTSRQMCLSLHRRATPTLTFTLGEADENPSNTPSNCKLTNVNLSMHAWKKMSHLACECAYCNFGWGVITN